MLERLRHEEAPIDIGGDLGAFGTLFEGSLTAETFMLTALGILN